MRFLPVGTRKGRKDPELKQYITYIYDFARDVEVVIFVSPKSSRCTVLLPPLAPQPRKYSMSSWRIFILLALSQISVVNCAIGRAARPLVILPYLM